MSAHLKQAIVKVSQVGHELAMQETGDEFRDLHKAQLLDKLIHEVKEMLGYAIDTVPTYIPDRMDDDTFKYLKTHIDALDEDGELAEVIKGLEEVTDETRPDYVRIV